MSASHAVFECPEVMAKRERREGVDSNDVANANPIPKRHTNLAGATGQRKSLV